MKGDTTMKKTLALVLTLVMVLSLAAVASAETVEAIPLTFYHSGYVGVWSEEEAYIDNVEKEFYEDTGILLDFTVLGTSHEESYSYISTKIAGGELDFVKSAAPAHMKELAQDGYLLPLQDLIEEYGQNLLNAVNPLGFKFGEIDGVNYLIPYIGDYSMYVCTWIRWDLFEKAGFTELPKTSTELVDMMYVVMEQNPELVGMTTYYPNWPWQHSFPRWYHYNPNNRYNYASCDENGEPYEVIYGANIPIYLNEPAYEEHLAWLAQLYQDGIIHQEIFTMDSTQYDTLMGQGRLFVVCDGWGFQDTADKRSGKHPDFPLAEGQEAEDWCLLAMLRNPNGSPSIWAAGLEGLQTSYGGVVDGCDYAKEIIQFYNWTYGGEEIYRICSWGIEGVHWEWNEENGKKKTYVDEAGTAYCSGTFGTNFGNFYLPYAQEKTRNYIGTEWAQIYGEVNVDWIGFFEDDSSLGIVADDTLASAERGAFASEKIVEILSGKVGVTEGMQQLRDGLNAMGWEDYWQNDYVPKYKAGMIEKYGEDYVNHP